mgnify:FL=1
MPIAVFGRGFPTSTRESVACMFDTFRDLKLDVWVFEPFFRFLEENADIRPQVAGLFTDHKSLPKETEFLFSLGGDGTFLETVTLVRDSGIPVLGVNVGRLGFLSYISQDTLTESLESVFNGRVDIEERMMLQVETSHQKLEGLDVALNEVRIYKTSGSLITVRVRTEEEFLTSYWADGLLLSTPTGSTAYNLSVGGPIVVPESHSIILSPIAPHNLNLRPLVMPDSAILHLSVDTREPNFQLALDSRTTDLPTETEITVRKADYTLKMIRIENISFYRTLRNKLMWGADKRN